MSVKIINIIHPKTGKTTCVKPIGNDLYKTPDGIMIEKHELKEDCSNGILGMGLLFGVVLFFYQLF